MWCVPDRAHMKKIFIISDRTLPLFAQLSFPGVSSIVCTADGLDDSLGKDSFVLLDAARLDADSLEYCCELARTSGAALCAFADDGWHEEKLLLDNGIACFIGTEALTDDPLSLYSLFHSGEGKDLAVFIDDDPARSAIAGMIFTLFGYRFLSLKNPEELFSIKESGDLFVLHNITMKDADLLSFVKKGVVSNLFRSMPYIAFTHGSEGVTLREINSGISRLTGYILSEEEVWSVVVFNFFKKALYAAADGYSRKVRLGENAEWTKDPVRKLFFSREAKFFTAPCTADAAHLMSADGFLSSLKLEHDRMKFLSWLVRDQQSKTNMAYGPHC